MLKKFLTEPLLHFTAVAALVFLIASVNSAANTNGSNTPNVIEVSESDIVGLMQRMDPTLNPQAAASQLKNLPVAQRQNLVRQFVEREALYREAKYLELDQSDAVVRQRLVQRMRFLLQGLSNEQEVSEAELRQFYAENLANYRVPAKISFKHLFFKSSDDATDAARQRAEARLAGDQAITADSFHYHSAYLDRTEAQIGRHFGPQFARQVMQLEADPDRLQGPLQSAYGYHLVSISNRYSATTPEYEEVQTRVRDSFNSQQLKNKEREAISRLLARYTIIEPSWSN